MSRVFCFADNIDTDCILPGQYLNISSPQELAQVCMAGYDKNFAAQIKHGDIFVAGSSFGCGSSREHAPISIKAAGVSCVIAGSFARIFYRNAINIGLPVLESPQAVADIQADDHVTVNLAEGLIINNTTGAQYTFTPFPDSIMAILNVGGLVEYVKNKKSNNK